jgi:hypothetical protein
MTLSDDGLLAWQVNFVQFNGLLSNASKRSILASADALQAVQLLDGAARR